MYTKFVKENIPTDKIWCVPFENAPIECLNSATSIEIDQSIISEDSFIIYTTYKDKPYFLGYCIISNRNISTSYQYNALRDNTLNINGCDVNDKLPFEKCICIEKWVFDQSLKKRDLLKQIFSILACTLHEHETIIMWCEGISELIFYPINNSEQYWVYPHVSDYFTNAFLNL